MAYVATGPAYTRVREVVEGATVLLRQIAVGTFSGDMPENEGEMEKARAAVIGAKAEALITGMSRNASSPPLLSNVAFYDTDWRVKVVRLLPRGAQISDSARDAIKALAASDADVLRQALEFPNNLATTAAGTATGIISGLLTYQSSAATVRGAVDDGAQSIETDHRFTAILRSTPATS